MSQIILLTLPILIIWLAVISYLVFKMTSHYNQLTKSVKGEDLVKILDSILAKSEIVEKQLEKNHQKIKEIEEDNQKHLQKFSLLRFNPYQDVGGDQSFIVSLLDQKNNGLVISSMHGRDKTRIYAKKVSASSGKEHSLSDEEKQAIELANE